jgi:hypothetical protein
MDVSAVTVMPFVRGGKGGLGRTRHADIGAVHGRYRGSASSEGVTSVLPALSSPSASPTG